MFMSVCPPELSKRIFSRINNHVVLISGTYFVIWSRGCRRQISDYDRITAA